MKVGVSQNFSMEWPLVKSLLWALLLFVQIHEHKACIEEERISLLELKAFLKSHTNYTKPLLPTWVYETKSECCSWERINCNTTTGHVFNLMLSNINQGPYYGGGNWFLNVSLLQSFKELRILDLSGNGIAGWLGNEELVYLSNLEVLILRWNQLNGSLPFKDMENFSNLEVLDLSGNHFTGSIIPYIGALSSLKAISLFGNKLNGTLDATDLCALKKLEELDLSVNDFEGILPPCLNDLKSLRLLDISRNRFSGNLSTSPIANLTSLEYIDLSYNFFGGSLSSSPIAGLTSLEYIDLSSNHFEGIFSFNIFANLSKLKVIQFLNDNNKLDIEIEDPSWGDPLFQLKTLALSNCNPNKLTGNMPKFLFKQHELEDVAISHSKLNGSFPIWLIENNTRLELLDLRSNSFTGQFHLPSYHHMNLRLLYVADNNIDGHLQEDIGKIFPKLEYLNLSQNQFEGNILSSIGGMSHLELLDLSSNKFSGEVTMESVANCTSLKVLSLSNNYFYGDFFSKNFNISMFSLDLSKNYFTGSLPVVPHDLDFLDISNNHMSGTIPAWNNMTKPRTLVLSDNAFEGQIPCELGSSYIIDLSFNLLSGSLPSCLNLQVIRHVFLRGNKLTGTLPVIFNSSSLLTLDFSENSFSGCIPDEIDGLSNLRVLMLGGNHFSGVIPKQLCRLNMINIMDLSENLFSGTIPHCFHNITFGNLPANHFAYKTNRSYWAIFVEFTHTYKSLLNELIFIDENLEFYEHIEEDKKVVIEFVTKHRRDPYKSSILDYMSGLDVSCNKLIGGIPPELGQLSSIHVLNLSYNQLTGPIPKTFSNLKNLESLDLSHNNLSGEIPLVLTNLTFLEIFNVAHNNLSGKVPDIKQFGTFGESNYEGNPFLCGASLEKSCTKTDESPPSPQKSSEATDNKWYEVDVLVFFTSFWVSYTIFFLGVASVLYINPLWRQRCFNIVEDCMYWCYYFALNTLRRLLP